MTYPVNMVANWFLHKEPMTHKKVQKLCYYAQAWSYALRDCPLIDDKFEAWVHGPVSPALYQILKGHYWETINPMENIPDIRNDDDLQLLENVWVTYGDQTGNALDVRSQEIS